LSKSKVKDFFGKIPKVMVKMRQMSNSN